MIVKRSFDPIFKAKSIAIYGVSANPIKVGGRPLRYLLEQGYTGEIYPINPNYDTVQGIKCYKSVEELPRDIDLVLLIVSATATPDALRRCGEHGIKSAVVLSAGFGEVGEDGKALQRQLTELAKEYNMCILGPNCLGMMNITDRIPGTFASVLEQKDILAGPITLLSQSGAFGNHILGMAQEEKLGFNFWITTGNEADIQFNDCLEYVANDERTSVVAGYVEDVRDGKKFMHALDACLEQEKPVVLMKSGKTSSGSKAAMSHTGALAGNYQVYQAAFRQKGVVLAENLRDLLDYSAVLSQKKQVNGNRVAIITISGGAGALMADNCEENGLALSEFSPETERKLKEVLPAFASVKNPVDVTAQAVGNPDLFANALQICLQDESADVLIVYLGLLKGTGLRIAEKIAQVAETTDKPLVVTWVAGPEDALTELKSHNVMTFGEPIQGIKAVSKLVGYRLFLQERARRQITAQDQRTQQRDVTELKTWLHEIRKERKVLSEYEARRVLQAFDIPVVEGDLAHSAQEAVAIAQRIGYPVVLKVNSADVPHKSDVGGVVLRLENEEAVVKAYDTILSNVADALPQAKLDGVLVLKMERCSAETLIGVHTDPMFGPTVAFGMGGIFVEVFKDASLRVLPIDAAEAADMLCDIRGKKILDGVRGQSASDQTAIVDVLTKVSQLAMALRDEVAELDINPLFTFPQNEGAKAGDALLVLK